MLELQRHWAHVFAMSTSAVLDILFLVWVAGCDFDQLSEMLIKLQARPATNGCCPPVAEKSAANSECNPNASDSGHCQQVPDTKSSWVAADETTDTAYSQPTTKPKHTQHKPVDAGTMVGNDAAPRNLVAPIEEVGARVHTRGGCAVASMVHKLAKLIAIKHKTPAQHWRTVRHSKQIIRQAHIAEVTNGEDARPHVTVKINDAELRGLLDSGASISCLGKDALKTLHRCGLRWKEVRGMKITSASEHEVSMVGFADAQVTFQQKTKTIRLYIVPQLANVSYFGIDFWLAFDLMPKLDELAIGTVPIGEEEAEVEQELPDTHTLSDEQARRLKQIIDMFPSCEAEGLGKTTLIQHKIEVGNATPTKQRYHAVSPAVEAKMHAEVDRMLQLGVIEECVSPWSSPVTCVTKSNGKTRLCLDARKVNEVTSKDAFPMPLIETILSRLSDTFYISSVDLKDAFWQIELDVESRDKTAFTVPGRPLYQFTRMPFGLCNAAQTMCRLMDLAISPAIRDNVFVYIDDLLIVSATFEQHLVRLAAVAQSLRRANLTINVEKSKFVMKSIRYLGHIVGNGEIKADPSRVQAISDFPVPRTVRQVRRFLGMTGWYSRYISSYAAVAAPITDTLKKSDRFTWTAEAQNAFVHLKNCLSTAPVLTHADYSTHFYIQCDASMNGVGGVLFQIQNGEEHPIAYMSKKLNTAQKNYTVTELECLAAVLSIERFKCYIEGYPFTVITDHSSLKWLIGQRDLKGRLARWVYRLQPLDFKIEHRKGTENVVPDALSRDLVEAIDVRVRPTISLTDPAFNTSEYKDLVNTIQGKKI